GGALRGGQQAGEEGSGLRASHRGEPGLPERQGGSGGNPEERPGNHLQGEDGPAALLRGRPFGRLSRGGADSRPGERRRRAERRDCPSGGGPPAGEASAVSGAMIHSETSAPAAPPRVSLIIPAYNEAAYLPRLLDSVDAARARFARGAEAVEVIVADNASSDA